MVDEVEVKFRVMYRYIPDEFDSCIGVIEVQLPADEDQALLPILQSAEETVCFSTLESRWGSSVTGAHARTRSMRVTGRTWSDVEEQVQQAREEVVETLRRVISRNISMIETTPAPEEAVITLQVPGVVKD